RVDMKSLEKYRILKMLQPMPMKLSAGKRFLFLMVRTFNTRMMSTTRLYFLYNTIKVRCSMEVGITGIIRGGRLFREPVKECQRRISSIPQNIYLPSLGSTTTVLKGPSEMYERRRMPVLS